MFKSKEMKRVNRVNDKIKRQQYEQASLLLPWYITGKLAQAESEKVDAVLKVSSELRNELVRQLEMSEMIKEDPDVLDLTAISSQDRRLESLIAHINKNPTRLANSDSQSFLQRLLDRFLYKETGKSSLLHSTSSVGLSKKSWLSSHRWQAAFSLFIVSQVAILAIVMNKSDNTFSSGAEYELAGADSTYVSSGQPVLTFQFTKQADEEVINKLFNKVDAEIVEHSEGSSNYKVVLKSGLSEQEIESLIRDLEKQSDLILLIGRGFY